MSKPTIAFHGGPVGGMLLSVLERALPDFQIVEAGTPDAIAHAEILATLGDTREALSAALSENIRWVHVIGAGVDAFPLDILDDQIMTCSRGSSAPAIAEFALAAMLAFEKQIPERWLDKAPEQWNLAQLGGLEGKSIGILGLGAIGSAIAQRALAFDMNIHALRRSGSQTLLDGVSMAPDVESLLAVSDHVVIAAAATPATYHLINDETLRSIKPGAHLVNVARGSLVDHAALLRALDDGRIARASLDVCDPEPLPAGDPLYTHEKVRLTPHISWSSPTTMQRTIGMFLENVERYRDGDELIGVVDVAEGY